MLWVLTEVLFHICFAVQPDRAQPSTSSGNVFQHEALSGNISQVFQGADRNGDGFLGRSELEGFLRGQKHNPSPSRSAQKAAAYPAPVTTRYAKQRVQFTPDGTTARKWSVGVNGTKPDALAVLPNSTNVHMEAVISLPNHTNLPEIPKAQKKTVSVPMGPNAYGLAPNKKQEQLPLPAAPASGEQKAPVTLPVVPTARPIEDPKPQYPPPCNCEKDSPAWRRPSRSTPSCFFFDFGAGDGETFRAFLGQSTKWQFKFDTGTFRPQDCFVYLMDPNPKYEGDLKDITALLPVGQVMHVPGTAAYMCDKENATFYLDITSPQGWGSSLDPDHESVRRTANSSNVHVSLMNMIRLLKENTIESDTVVVKLDVEGAEWDLLPCLANSSAASLIDTLYLESHCEQNSATKIKWCPSNGMVENSEEVFKASVSSLKQKGVHVPEYWSPLLL